MKVYVGKKGRYIVLRIALFILEARERYKSALDDITGHDLFGTTESRNNLQVSKA